MTHLEDMAAIERAEKDAAEKWIVSLTHAQLVGEIERRLAATLGDLRSNPEFSSAMLDAAGIIAREKKP